MGSSADSSSASRNIRGFLLCRRTSFRCTPRELDQDPQIIHAGPDNAELGNDGRDEARRRNIEGRVVGFCILRSDPRPVDFEDLRGRPYFYRDSIPVGGLQIYRGRGRRHDKWHAICSGGESEGVGAHLVSDVAVRGDTVGPRYDDIDIARSDQASGAGVDRYLVWNSHTLELPGGEARSLKQGANL